MLNYIRTKHNENKYQLTINDVPVDDEEGSVSVYNDVVRGYVRDENLYRQITVLTPNQILDRFSNMDIRYPEYLDEELKGFYLDGIELERVSINTITITFKLSFDIDEWKQPWRMVDHAKKFIFLFVDKNTTNAKIEMLMQEVDEESYFTNEILVYGVIENPDVVMVLIIDDYINFLTDVLQETILHLRLNAQNESVIMSFNFPEEVKIACEQYLLYFVQFLKDIGIDATAELKEEVNNVLFLVNPKNKDEALENIREALQIYLRLPAIKENDISLLSDADIETQRLSAEIYHFKSQLMFASAAIQQKDLFIQQQQDFIQQQLLSGQVLIQSVNQVNKTRDSSDKEEPLVGDIVNVKDWQWEMLHVDFPTLLRRLKQYFSRNKS